MVKHVMQTSMRVVGRITNSMAMVFVMRRTGNCTTVAGRMQIKKVLEYIHGVTLSDMMGAGETTSGTAPVCVSGRRGEATKANGRMTRKMAMGYAHILTAQAMMEAGR